MAEKGPLSITFENHGKDMVVSPVGEVGYHEAPALRAALRDALDKRPGRLIANLSGVGYMATPGLATLIEALQISKRTSVPLVVCGLTDRVRAIFEIARLHQVFKIVPDLPSALQS